MNGETIKTVMLVSTLGIVGYFIDKKLKEKPKIVKETIKELVITMESINII